MSDTIRNQDGSVYMTFGPSVPSSADLEGWYVRQVLTADRIPKGRGTGVASDDDVRSLNSLLRLLGDLEAQYGYRPLSSKIAEGTFRWTFERRTPRGHRLTSMVIASRIG